MSKHEAGDRADSQFEMSDLCPDDPSPWVSPDGTFMKTVLVQGTGVEKPKEGSLCHVHLDLEAGGAPAGEGAFRCATGEWTELTLGEGDVPWDAVLDQCLETMLDGEVCRVRACPTRYSPGCAFTLGLAGFTPGRDSWEMTFEEKWSLALRDKERGTQSFRQGNAWGAARRYGRALRLLVSVATAVPPEVGEEYGRTKMALHANLAACQLRLGQHENAAHNCDKALEREPCAVKALYRRAVAHAALNELEKAGVDLQEVLRLEPGNAAARRELRRLAEKARERDTEMAKKMRKLFV
ncbi:FK506-binding protein-like [Rhinatrema bivittatum]|uniref:FK506-binding protein-like n=1 Tax=Rhinatrema bivittatum TaxID=194408 RepID=UPI001127FE6E|nr:FK506-binding protein-like [Rhinatrema bivittatum]XP_029441756.1 FK506-binding protein-like [Rhinatrema bivittatum]XP_029441757.1 FK506-binding protein-like [Rhinatrema bivittatum]XP_029441758.1 FK506-binding protein-like [Rhinatrema bivittatum]XP_029441759.1 FK506-binding protein-like [Rhinatrema bivittatum]XP_029441760.1 FK506-binding protein-like [Rhinatrema bivittatum]